MSQRPYIRDFSIVDGKQHDYLVSPKDHSECYLPCGDPWCDTLYCSECSCGPMTFSDDCRCECHADDWESEN